MATLTELLDDIRRQEGRVNFTKKILADREQALALVSSIEAQFHDVMWNRGAQSGARLFECHHWLEREIQQAKSWVQEEERRLHLLQRQRANTP